MQRSFAEEVPLAGRPVTTSPAELARTPAVWLRGVSKRYDGQLAVDDLTLEVADGEFFALLGPSGCGKTTTLKLIAGFEQPSAGEILIRGQPVGAEPAFRRNVNMVFQNYALFPHLNVRDNVAFGLRMKGTKRRARLQAAEAALERVHLAGIAKRKIDQLSGGQQQRVALARALINRPAVLLLDEPLGALDLKLRKAMQLELKAIQQEVGISFIYVTHDQGEALAMADRVAVMHQGQALQIGRPQEIYEQPRSRFVAAFIGESGFISGRIAVSSDGGTRLVLADASAIRVGRVAGAARPGAHGTILVRPEAVRILRSGEAASPNENTVAATISEVEYVGSDTFFYLETTGGERLIARGQADSSVDEGMRVTAAFPFEAVVLLDPELESAPPEQSDLVDEQLDFAEQRPPA
jgi:spermidine/putrescine transport system ATP-binding protein